MSCGEEKAKRWRISVRDLLLFITITSLGFGVLRFTVVIDPSPREPLFFGYFVGLSVLGGGIGGLLGRLASIGVLEGFSCGVAIVLMVVFFLLALVISLL